MKTILRFRALLPWMLFALGANSALALNCGSLVSGVVTLTADLTCNNTAGLQVVADNTTINLNGHTITCVGAGFAGSCQMPMGPTGILSISHNQVAISGPGTISGFEVGIGAFNGKGLLIRDVTVTGPPQTDVLNNPRQPSFGILINGATCSVANIASSTFVLSSEISNHMKGIQLQNANCVTLAGNNIHDNNGPQDSHGIAVVNSANAVLMRNFVHANGSNNYLNVADSGIEIVGPGSINNTVEYNSVLNNCGNGIVTRNGAQANNTFSNVARFNPSALGAQCHRVSVDFHSYDLGTFNAGAAGNTWNANNLCRTQSAGIPAGVCNPGE